MHIVNSQPENEKTFFINIHKTSKGAGPVRNAAIPYIDTEWTAFVDDDDTISDSYVSDLRYYSKIFPEADLIIFRSVHIINKEYLIVPRLYTTDTIEIGNVGIYFAVKTRILQKIQFDDMHAEDFDFIRKCDAARYAIWLSRYINYFVRFTPKIDELNKLKNNEKNLSAKKIRVFARS